MYKSLSLVYDKLMDVDYATYTNIINQELEDRNNLLILDLGCGSGNLTRHLTKYGKVFATDISEEMLSLASGKVSDATYFCINLLEIETLNIKYDFILSAFDVFNYLDNFEEFKTGLKAVYNCLLEEGLFIFDIHTPKKINYLLTEQPFTYEDDDISYQWFTYSTENELEVESELTFFIHEREDLYRKKYEYQKQRTYEINDIIRAIEETGFIIKRYYCDFKEKVDYAEADRIIFVLKK